MAWLPEHVKSRYAAGMVIAVTADRRSVTHSVQMSHLYPRGVIARPVLCTTSRPDRVCDCGLFAIEWVESGSVAGAIKNEETA